MLLVGRQVTTLRGFPEGHKPFYHPENEKRNWRTILRMKRRIPIIEILVDIGICNFQGQVEREQLTAVSSNGIPQGQKGEL